MDTFSKSKASTLLKFIGKDTVNSVENFILDVKNRNFESFVSEEQIISVFNNYLLDFYSNSSSFDIESIRYYTGIAFNEVNAILRGIWDYEKNGILTDDRRKKCMKLAEDLSIALTKGPDHLPGNIRAYRGVSISAFKEYGINDIKDLKNIVGQYYYESAFTSTSLLRDKSFFDRDLEWHDKCNIEIEYCIPEEFNDGLPLITSDLSYSKGQSEFLINKGSLSKIIDVNVSEDGTKAYVKMIFVPQKVWDIKPPIYHNTK